MPNAASLLPLACDSVSQLEVAATASGTGWYAQRVGNMAVVSIENVTLSSGTMRTLGTVPTAFRPARAWFGALNANSSAGYASIGADGKLVAYSKSSGDFSGQVVYAV